MVNFMLMIAGVLGVICGVVLIIPAGYIGTLLGAMFLCMGVGVFVMGLLRRRTFRLTTGYVSPFSECRFYCSD